jgi:Fe-Mn family superoxide dismutase
MNKLEERVHLLNEQILLQEKNQDKLLFLNEMKKIGIEKLPYSYSSLKQFIDSETMSYHYNKHYKGYVDKLNKALSKKDYGDLELEEIIKSISKFNTTIRNNAGGAFNHALFWKMLSPKKQTPKGELLKKIKSEFGSFNEFKTQFEEVAKERFGSGWVWLVLTKKNQLKIMSTPNQDNPLMNVIKSGGYPILGLDLWEHAYYLKYKNKRDEYISNFWRCVNWEFVDELFSLRTKRKLNESMKIKQVLNEGISERCSKEENESIRFIFNINPKVKQIFRFKIDSILKDVFKEHYYEKGEYGENESSGIYDLESDGRSVINKLNTNYTCFCILLNDVNKVLSRENLPKINLIGQPPFAQISETRKFVNVLDKYKNRIFDVNSATFSNIMSTLTKTNQIGDKTENSTVNILKKKFGDENVIQIGKLGSTEDMVGGVDCEIVIDSETKTAQIKPYSSIKKSDNKYVIYGTGQVKPYKTDFLIFTKGNKEVLVFKNESTKIVNGNFVLPVDNLIYQLN